MLDIRFIRENKDLIKEAARKKHIDFDVDLLIVSDDKRKALLTSVEAKRAEQNDANNKISLATQDERATLIEEMKKVKDALTREEESLKEVMKEWQALMVAVPNIPDMSVPEGKSDEDNKEIRAWGTKPKFPFKPKSHIELMEANDMADFDRGSKISGFRGYVLKNDAVLLNFAIWQFVLDQMIPKGFSPLMMPSLVKRAAFMGTGYLPQSEEDLYKTQDGEYLSGTAEVPTMGYFMDETLDASKLPMKFVAFSPCFRREAGSHGKQTKGLYRVHEFFKLEQLILCEANHETSVRLHEELRENAEEILQLLNLPYRVVVNCGGDIGLGQVKKYDIETWIPSEERYGETHSASYFHDFQTRRLNIKYKDADGKSVFAHSLNNTAVATPRILISIIENNQQEDGSIAVPEPLQQYIGKEFLGKK